LTQKYVKHTQKINVLSERNKGTEKCDAGDWKQDQKQITNTHLKTRHVRHSSRTCGVFGLLALKLFTDNIKQTRHTWGLQKALFFANTVFDTPVASLPYLDESQFRLKEKAEACQDTIFIEISLSCAIKIACEDRKIYHGGGLEGY